jgi:hypothetical protein
MKDFMGSHHTFQDKSALNKGRLVNGGNDAHDNSKSISRNFSKDFKTTIQKANRTELLHVTSIWLFWDQTSELK